MISSESGLTIFDRKFIAEHLKLFLKCAKCSHHFSDRYEVSKNNYSGHRPLLLPCGHSMCENCIFKHRHNLECAVCTSPAPPTIGLKDPNTKYKFNPRDYYEIDYHALGAARCLDYYRRFSENSINKSLQCTSSSEIVVPIQCGECINHPPIGKCKQCNSFYCKHCFEAVHRHNPVLKGHKLSRMEDERNFEKVIRVGKDAFQVPTVHHCNMHDKTKDIFCLRCRRICCEKCLPCFHRNHQICTLAEMNMRHLTEIPASINCINIALFHINNSQQIVKNTKEKLKSYAAETEANILACFHHLHGLLQNAELRVVETLRESSLQPQMLLNETMGLLDGYKSVIENLRKALVYEDTDEVPQGILIQNVIQLVYEYMEKIPSGIEVTKIESNPFIFSCGRENLSDLFSRHFKCKFKDPNIKVHLLNELDFEDDAMASNSVAEPGRELSAGTNNFGVQSSPSKDKQTTSKKTKTKKRNLSAMNRGSKPHIDRSSSNGELDNELIHSFSGIDITARSSNNSSHTVDIDDSPRSLSFGVPKPQVPSSSISKSRKNSRSKTAQLSTSAGNQIASWFKSDVIVQVRGIKSPVDFYVQGVNEIQRIRKQVEACANSSDVERLSPSSIIVGQHYLTYHNNVDRWQRALVSQKLEERDCYIVFLPDIGLYVTVHSSSFCKLPESLAYLPYAAVHCSLKQLMPGDGGSKWSDRANAFFKQVVQSDNQVYVSVIRPVNPEMYEVDLITFNNGVSISIRESFLYTGLARDCSISGKMKDCAPSVATKQMPLMALKQQRIQKCVPHVGTVFMVQILHVVHPNEFYVAHCNDAQKLDTMQESLSRFMDDMALAQLEQIFLGSLQLACVVQKGDSWYRACIEELLPEGFVIVRLVDYGRKHQVYWDQLFALPKCFSSSELSIHCSLADVQTLPEHSYRWTPEAIECFKLYASNPNLQMEVVGSREGVNLVALHFGRAGSENNSIGALLVKKGHCISTGPSSDMYVEPRNQRILMPELHRLMHSLKNSPDQCGSRTLARQKSPTDSVERVPIVVLWVEHPGEFYATLPHFVTSIENTIDKVQELANKSYKSAAVNQNWQVGEHCYVNAKAGLDFETQWHRGVIKEAITHPQKILYNVQLRDLGQTLIGIEGSQLTAMDEHNNSISNAATPCQLRGILPARGTNWSSRAIEFFKDQVKAFDGLSVTGGRDPLKSVLSVTLWGSHCEISGPFSPTRTRYVSINESMVISGFAIKDATIVANKTKDTVEVEEPESPKVEVNLEELKQYFDSVDKISATVHAKCKFNEPSETTDFEENEDMPCLELLDNFNLDTDTIGCHNAPAAWLKERSFKQVLFTARATYVNHDLEIFLTHDTDQPFLRRMRNLLQKIFKPLFQEFSGKTFTYVVGQPVVAIYHHDQSIYRAIVTKKKSRTKYDVFFLDYGNEEDVESHELLPYAPFPDLHAMCWRVTLDGIKPRDKSYSLLQMDIVHGKLVERLSSVCVVNKKGPKGLPSCKIRVNNMDIAKFMVESGMSIFAQSKAERRFDSPPRFPKETEKEYVLGEVDQNNTTSKPPPPKKKFVLDLEEVGRLDCVEDRDCREMAEEIAQQNAGYYLVDNEPASEREEDNTGGPPDYWTDSDDIDEDEGIEDIELPHNPNGVACENVNDFEPHLPHFIHPQRLSAIQQLKQREKLCHEEMLMNADFDPMETSTEFSHFDEDSRFASQNLPEGVLNFHCTIDKVLSATELQITPDLSELSKRNLKLIETIRELVKSAPQLTSVEPGALCLALYPKDQEWYRATIKDVCELKQEATVLYIDFHNSSIVRLEHLKEMPKQLYQFPLRSFRVRLHGVKMNTKFEERMVRQALLNCVSKYSKVYARVHYPPNYHNTNNDDDEDAKSLEVDLYKNKHSEKRLYEDIFNTSMIQRR
ncbi:uncharacterized protein LOC115621672 [Scaptodrosophila lebanonensis]|uniref:Uncharacterized protein LOC115621672 n=1 Tax=Drosophila lebanonensis TaxID=7225 RepID=A0A6J2T7Y4_DROLE|nr:uncharacterized protein LOC115621672 [Scaptodrosophila lebanonensis]